MKFQISDEFINTLLSELESECEIKTARMNFLACKSMVTSKVKRELTEMAINGLQNSGLKPTIRYNRIQIIEKKDSGMVDERGNWSIFATTMKTVMTVKKFEPFKKKGIDGRAFKTEFTGEGSIDDGGPYREIFSNMVEELHSDVLLLLIPTQNNKNDHGFGRDLWTINPGYQKPSMYRFLGGLLGFGFRTGQTMDFKLSPIFWKQLIGQPCTLEDLENSDQYATQLIAEVEKMKSEVCDLLIL